MEPNCRGEHAGVGQRGHEFHRALPALLSPPQGKNGRAAEPLRRHIRAGSNAIAMVLSYECFSTLENVMPLIYFVSHSPHAASPPPVAKLNLVTRFSASRFLPQPPLFISTRHSLHSARLKPGLASLAIATVVVAAGTLEHRHAHVAADVALSLIRNTTLHTVSGCRRRHHGQRGGRRCLGLFLDPRQGDPPRAVIFPARPRWASCPRGT